MRYFNNQDPKFQPTPTKINFDPAEVADKFLSEIDSLGYNMQMEVISCMASRISGSIESRVIALNEEKNRIEMELKHLGGLINSR